MRPSFRTKVLDYYKKNKRAMPWRETTDPYKIFISEVMLQQTQVDRVRIKYAEFLEAFPAPQDVAAASVVDVLKVWKGLGYNRRCLNLKRAMEVVVRDHAGKIPQTMQELDALPGIGPATAAAICAYAFQEPTVFIETNIRSVFIHHFASGQKISDAELLPLIEKYLDRKNPREWYYALMDYGAMLKRTRINPSRASKHYSKQSKFEGSNRQLRGKILEVYLKSASVSAKKKFALEDVIRALSISAHKDTTRRHGPLKAYLSDKSRLEKIFTELKSEGFFQS